MPQSKDQDRSKGVEPDAVKVASPVLNGEVEETDRQVLRLDLTQLALGSTAPECTEPTA
jgi:hypothetical protein